MWTWYFSLSFHSAQIPSAVSFAMKDARSLCDRRPAYFLLSENPFEEATSVCPTWLYSSEDEDGELMWTPGIP